MVKTPWQKVHDKFRMTQVGLAAAIGRDRSKISRHLADDKGLISGRDQELIMEAAAAHGVAIEPSDLVPVSA